MRKKVLIFLLISILVFIIIFFTALMVGRYHIGFVDFWKALFTNNPEFQQQRNVIINLRLPRTLMASLCGVALCLSGLLYQETFQNPLVSPDLLGVSNGASVGAALAIVLGLGSVLVSLFSFVLGIGAMAATIFIAKSFKSKKNVTLLLAGIIISTLMASILAIIKYCAKPETQLVEITYWLMGSFSNATMNKVYIVLPIVVICTVFLLCIRWRINVVALGREEAISKGINYGVYRTIIIIIATLLTTTSVCFCGTISWIGLVIPHLVRLIAGKNTTKSMPLTITFGAVFMVITDIICRSFTAAELPVSAITGIFGTILFVIILITKRGSIHAN